jgi:hypothetical protein
MCGEIQAGGLNDWTKNLIILATDKRMIERKILIEREGIRVCLHKYTFTNVDNTPSYSEVLQALVKVKERDKNYYIIFLAIKDGKGKLVDKSLWPKEAIEAAGEIQKIDP